MARVDETRFVVLAIAIVNAFGAGSSVYIIRHNNGRLRWRHRRWRTHVDLSVCMDR